MLLRRRGNRATPTLPGATDTHLKRRQRRRPPPAGRRRWHQKPVGRHRVVHVRPPNTGKLVQDRRVDNYACTRADSAAGPAAAQRPDSRSRPYLSDHLLSSPSCLPRAASRPRGDRRRHGRRETPARRSPRCTIGSAPQDSVGADCELPRRQVLRSRQTSVKHGRGRPPGCGLFG